MLYVIFLTHSPQVRVAQSLSMAILFTSMHIGTYNVPARIDQARAWHVQFLVFSFCFFSSAFANEREKCDIVPLQL